MKATFALLADYQTHNAARKLSVAIKRQFHIGLPTLPPHVSLKQPFVVDDLTRIEKYFDAFASSFAPVFLTLPKLGLWTMPGQNEGQTSVLCIDVAEDEALRELHHRLNNELAERFQNTQAPFDGEEYHFHLTVATGGASVDVYQQAYEQCRAVWRPITCLATGIVLFYYEDSSQSGQFTTYKVLPLGGRPSKP